MIKITILIKWSLTEADLYIRVYKAMKLMFNINTGILNFSGYYLFNSASHYRTSYLDEIYWIIADKSEI